LIPASALAFLSFLGQRSVAQSTTSLLPDADLLPSRTIRLRGLTAWTRYDELLGTGGVVPRNIASTLATDSLGSAQVPSFAPIEAQIAGAALMPNFHLTAGNVVAIGDSRIVTAPLIVEYGVTSRMTIGLVVPLVETRTTLYAQLNPTIGAANVGPNPALLAASSALNQNFNLVQSFRTAGTTLQNRLSACQATPTDPGCVTILAQQSAVQSLIQSSGAFATSLETLYGTDRSAHPGQAYVPIDLSQAQSAINTRIQSFAAQYKSFLGTSVITGNVTPAAGPAAQLDFDALFRTAGYDSLTSTDHTSIGDVTLGVSYQFLNTYGDTSAAAANATRWRLAANGAWRFPTGQPGNRNQLFDLATGYGENGVIASVAADVQFRRRVSATATASYTMQLGSVAVERVPDVANAVYPLAPAVPGTYTPGNVLAISVVPRYRLAGFWALTGQYSFIRTGADTYSIPVLAQGQMGPTPPFGVASWTAQQIGVGFTYSTIVGPNRWPGRIPFETTYSHIETITGNGGPLNKTFRDQVELRVYWKP
jgi:hypothetical protein